MRGPRNDVGSLSTCALILITFFALASLMPAKQDPLPALFSVITFFLALLGEVLLFCYFHYGEKPAQVWRRITTDN